jgi:hypothetical protein
MRVVHSYDFPTSVNALDFHDNCNFFIAGNDFDAKLNNPTTNVNI